MYTEQVMVSGTRGQPSEDGIFAFDDGHEALFLVLDGASGLGDSAFLFKEPFSARRMTGGEWITRRMLGSAQRRVSNPFTALPLIDLMKSLETEATHELKCWPEERWKGPCCSGIAVSVSRTRVNWLQFGDCMGGVKLVDGKVVVIGEDRVNQFDAQVIRMMKDRGVSRDDPEVRELLRHNRALRNGGPDGTVRPSYASLDGNLNVELCTSGSFARSEVKEVVLFTDGVFHHSADMGPQWFVECTLQRSGVLPIVHHVQMVEEKDLSRTRIPRLKNHDDKTALHIWL